MHKRNGLHVALSLTALLGWLLFVLGCTGWSSWSPDGSKLLFTYTQEVEGRTNASIALLDTKTSEVRTLFKCPDSDGPCSAQWRGDGTSALVFTKEEGITGFSVFDVPTAAGGVIRRIANVEGDSLLPPVPEVNGSLYFFGKPTTRVDLDTGAVKVLPESEETILFNWTSGRMLYGIERACADKDKSECRVEIGEMTAGDDSRNRLFEIRKSDPALNNPQELIAGIISTDPERSRFAIISKRQERDEILLYDRAGLLKVLKPRMPGGKFHIGNLQWARDGDTLFASVMQRLNGDEVQWSLAKISSHSGAVHLVPLARMKMSESDLADGIYVLLPLSLSPDGRTIAANSALIESNSIAPADRGLYLIDVDSHDGQRVTRIPVTSFAPKQ